MLDVKHNKITQYIINYALIISGAFLLAFGTVIFLTKCELVAGGLSGIAITIQHFCKVNVYDYIVSILTVVFWVFGLIFVGKKFALRTLVSSLAYIGFTFLCNRTPGLITLAEDFAGAYDTGNLIICALFGGVFIGLGVSLTYVGGGSTGGVDVIQFLCAKYLYIKESITSFVVDAIIIIASLIAMRMPVEGACGIISCFVTALLIDVVYIRFRGSFQADIISDKWEEISRYAQDELERGVTIIPIKGGYKGQDRIMIRIVFTKLQYQKLRNFIAEVDPKAFVTYTQTDAVYGEGFINHHKSHKKSKNKNL